MQVVALRGFMDGKKDRFCRYGDTCRQWRHGRCHMAHYPDEMVPECWAALQALLRQTLLERSFLHENNTNRIAHKRNEYI